MKIEIDISEFYLDSNEAENLEKTLKAFIIDEVVRSINKQIEKRVETQIIMEVKQQVEQSFIRKINSYVTETVLNEKIKSSRTKELISLSEYIKETFEDNSSWRNAGEAVKTLAKQFGDEMKKRYDLLFASQIVAQLNTNGLLKENVAALILENKS